MDNPPESVVTPFALRAQELIDHSKLDPPINIRNFGCILFELFPGNCLFKTFMFGRQRDIIDDDHLIQLPDAIEPPLEDAIVLCPRHNSYFG